MDKLILLKTQDLPNISLTHLSPLQTKINLLSRFYLWKKRFSILQKEYLVDLYQTNKRKVFNFIDKNLINIILIKNENIIKNNNGHQLELDFTIDGLFGLGSTLIRQAIYAKEEGSDITLDAKNSEYDFYRGVHLTETSPEIMPFIDENLEWDSTEEKNYQIRKKKAKEILEIMDYLDELRSYEQEYKRIINSSSFHDIRTEAVDINKELAIKNKYYLVNLFPCPEKIEPFETAHHNLLHVKLKRLSDAKILDKTMVSHVKLYLNSEGMLRLGEELIRLAMAAQLQHAGQLSIPLPTQNLNHRDLGLTLVSGSAELLITVNFSQKGTTSIKPIKRKKIIWPKNNKLNVVLEIAPNFLLIKSDSEYKRIRSSFYSPLFSSKFYLFKNIWRLTYSSYRTDLLSTIEDLRRKNFMFCVDNLPFSYQYTPWYQRFEKLGNALQLHWVNKNKIVIRRDFLRIGTY